MAFVKDIRHEIGGIDTSAGKLREFGLLFLVVLGGLAGFSWYRGGEAWPYLAGLAVFFGLAGLAVPRALRPVYLPWMGISVVMGWFMSRVILFLLFCLIFTPMALIMKLSGRDPLDRKLDRSAGTYWKEHTQRHTADSYRKQY